MSIASTIPAAVVLSVATIAAVTDVWKFKVYNALTLPVMLGGLLYHGIVGGPTALTASALGLVFGFAILLLFYAMGATGAGDVKLMAAIGAWLGMPLTFYIFIASALAGGIYAVSLLLLTSGTHETLVNLHIAWLRMKAFGRQLGPDVRIEAEVRRDDRRRRLIPFAAMVVIGVVATFLWLHDYVSP